MTMILKTGEVYFFDNTRSVSDPRSIRRVAYNHRILMADDFEVFTDGMYLNDPDYDYNIKKNLSGESIFTRSRRNFFEKCIEKVGEAPLSEEALSILWVDLPMRFGRLRNLSWDDACLGSIDNYLDWLEENTDIEWGNRVIEANALFIKPTSEKGMPRKPIKVEADNGKKFTVKELVWKAAQIQNAAVKKSIGQGIGLYRSGIKSKLPVYYVWGFYDLAGYLKEYENEGIDITHA